MIFTWWSFSGRATVGVKILIEYYNFWRLGIIKILLRTLSIRISSLCVCSMHASVPNVYAQWTHQFLMPMLSMLKGPLLSARISSWCVCSVHAFVPDSYAHCSVHASVPDAYARRVHKGQSIRISLQICSIILEYLKSKNFKKIFVINRWSQKSPKTFFLNGQTQF